jgi:poly(A) polymerase
VTAMTPTSKKAEIIHKKQHGISIKQISEQALTIVKHLNDVGFQAYIVGGCVRDLLIGKRPKDFDIATDALPKEIKQLFRNCRLIGRRFRLAHIYFGRKEIVEVATFRAAFGGIQTKEGMIIRDNTYGTIDQDAYRRDFTVNALYYHPKENIILDFTNGFQDLRNHVLQIIGDPEIRYREDPVRMLRAARFVGKLDLAPTKTTEAAILKLNHLLQNISPARLYDETIKLFQCGFAMKTFPAMEHYRLLTRLLPFTAACLKTNKTKAFITHVLHNTDKRVHEGKMVIPSFLFAALLWPSLLDTFKKLLEQNLPTLQAFDTASIEVLKEQMQYTMMPRWVKTSIQDIWALQPRLEKRSSKYIQKLFHHPRFRAGYDLLLLRTILEEHLNPIVNWWTEFQTASEGEKQTMIEMLS